MLFKKKEFKRSLVLSKNVCDGMISYCKMNHPDEMILLLKGKSKKGIMFAESLVIPPFSDTGPTFAGFPANQLPLTNYHLILIILGWLTHIQLEVQSHH